MPYNNCKYKNTCKLIREFCNQIEDCEMKKDLLMFIKTKSGKNSKENIEYVTYQNGKKYYTRKHGKRIILKHNIEFGKKSSAINKLWMSMPEGFKKDCKLYAQTYFKENSYNKMSLSNYNIFYKTIKNHIHQINNKYELIKLFGNTLDEWIKRGYLEKINEKINFQAEIITDL